MPVPGPTAARRRAPVATALAVAAIMAVVTALGCGEVAVDALSDPEEVVRRLGALRARTAAETVSREAAAVPAPDPERDATLSDDPAGLIEGVVRRAGDKSPLPARVLVDDGGGTEAGAVLSGVGFWCGGRFSVPLIPGRVRVGVSAGRRRSVFRQELIVKPGRRSRVRADIKRPGALAFESRGWVGADLFRPVGGAADRLRQPPSLGLLALAARAEGLAFLGAAAPWGGAGDATASDNWRRIARECAGLSGEGLTVAPSWRGSGAPFYGNMFFLGGRAARALPSPGWDMRSPNFLAIERARPDGAVAILRGIADGREMDPHSEIVALRPALAGLYRGASVALGETASELPFDVAAGVLPDALALSGSAGDEAVWFRLLSMGHRIPSVHAVNGSFSSGVLPAERTFVRLPEAPASGKGPAVDAIVDAIRAGRTMCSTGPFVFLRIDDRGPGSVLKGDGTARSVIFEAYSSTERGGEITALELIRNGEVIRSEPGQGRSFIAAKTVIPENETAWYIARARAGPGVRSVAWTSPVYFEGPGYAQPLPVATLVRGRVTDLRTGAPLEATVSARLLGRVTASAESDPLTGKYVIRCSPAALLTASAPGYLKGTERVFFHTGAMREIMAIHTNASGRGASVLADEATYERMRLACAEARIDMRLERERKKDGPERGATGR